MTNETLCQALHDIDLRSCKHIFNGIFYIKTDLPDYGNDDSMPGWKYEFLIITENNIKKAIILNCGNVDLHWYVLEEWRNQHVLSNALRTGVIKYLWPDVTKITCCFDYEDNRLSKYMLTSHLANLAEVDLEPIDTFDLMKYLRRMSNE